MTILRFGGLSHVEKFELPIVLIKVLQNAIDIFECGNYRANADVK